MYLFTAEKTKARRRSVHGHHAPVLVVAGLSATVLIIVARCATVGTAASKDSAVVVQSMLLFFSLHLC